MMRSSRFLRVDMTKLSNLMRRLGTTAMLAVPLAIAPVACTDLSEVPKDALTPDNAFKSEDEVLAGVASVYATLRGFGGPLWGHFNLSEVSTDEIIVPTRGSDWYDNGRWLEMYRQTWTANSGSALDDMNGIWNGLFAGVAKANLMISVLDKVGGTQKDAFQPELRTLRAFFYYLLQDLFGGVPLVTTTELAAKPRVSRDSIYRFVISELNAVRGALPERRAASQYGRVTRGAADAILASAYLNAEVFGGSVTSSGLTKGQARWADAITAADRVINSGVYSLATDWRGNFTPNNENSPENIFVVVHVAVAGLGTSLPMRTLHYNHLSLGPWNGFATIAETYRAFDPVDKRREMFLIGQQFSFNTGAAINDRAGNPLVLTVDIANPEQARENEGPRYNKFSPDPGAPAGDAHPNDFPFFRLAEMYLIKAEAANELGRTAEAIGYVNQVRARQFSPAKPLATNLSQADARTAILNERLFELAGEGKRRQDLIRAGKYLEARRFKVLREGYRLLFPIPSTQLQANSLLTQNAGY